MIIEMRTYKTKPGKMCIRDSSLAPPSRTTTFWGGVSGGRAGRLRRFLIGLAEAVFVFACGGDAFCSAGGACGFAGAAGVGSAAGACAAGTFSGGDFCSGTFCLGSGEACADEFGEAAGSCCGKIAAGKISQSVIANRQTMRMSCANRIVSYQ